MTQTEWGRIEDLPGDPLFRFDQRASATQVGPVPGVVIKAFLAFYPSTAVIGQWDAAKWNQAGSVWAGAATETDVACQIMSLSIQRGRDEPLSRFRVGVCSMVIDDPNGLYTPWSDASDSSAYSRIRPGIGLRITATYQGTTYPLFKGTVDAITDTFPNITGHAVAFNASDDLSYLGAYDGIEQPPIGDSDLAAQRLTRIFNMVGYQGVLKFDPGTIPLQPTTLAQNAENEAGIVIDTELGALLAQADGAILFKDRNGMVGDPHYTAVQYVFGEIAPELCYEDIELQTDASHVRNVVSISNAGGTAVTVSDARSIARYGGRRTYQRMDLVHKDEAQSLTIAQQYLANYADAAQRVEALGILPSVTPEVITAALRIDLLWRIQVRRRATGFQVVADLQVQGVEHAITPHEWRTTYRTFSANAVFAVGKWSVAKWDHGLWGF